MRKNIPLAMVVIGYIESVKRMLVAIGLRREDRIFESSIVINEPIPFDCDVEIFFTFKHSSTQHEIEWGHILSEEIDFLEIWTSPSFIISIRLSLNQPTKLVRNSLQNENRFNDRGKRPVMAWV